MKIVILNSDKKFTDSPDSGTKECLCSRCGLMIQEEEIPFRIFDSYDNTEYRYHMTCMEKTVGMDYLSNLLGYDIHSLSGNTGEYLQPIALNLMRKMEKDIGQSCHTRDEYLWLGQLYNGAIQQPKTTISWDKPSK